jgi:hypothetical protein
MSMHVTSDLENEQAEGNRIGNEIAALRQLAMTVPDDALAQASIAGQINALEWVLSGTR